MIRLISTQDTLLRDAFVNILGLARIEAGVSGFSVYKKQEWILVYSESITLDISLPSILENYLPDRVFLPFFGRSIDMIHEVGDVILPNVFLSYVPKNEHKIATQARFLEIYNEQKDYYVEDYGLSLGGIVVDHVPTDSELNTELMTEYEGDVYTESSLDSAYTVVASEEIPAVILCGIIDGKKTEKTDNQPYIQVARNIITTIRLMEENE